MRATTQILTAAALAAAVTPATADSLRCGGDLIDSGDSIMEVTEACGEPARETAITNEEGVRVGTALFYQPSGKSVRKVIIYGGEVAGIRRID